MSPDEHIIDALIFGSNSKHTQTKLLEKDAILTLVTALDIARTDEVKSNQIKGIATDNSTRIDALKRGQAPSNAANSSSQPCGPIIRLCGCSDSELDISQRSLSPAFGSICGACGKENHWRKVSRSSKPNRKEKNERGGSKHSKSSKEKRGPEKHLHTLETLDEAEVDNVAYLPEQLYFHTLLIDQAFLDGEVEADQGKKPLLCEVDTGAEGNVISLNSYKSLLPSSPCNPNGIPVNLASSSTTIVAFGGHPVDHHGICHLKLAHGSSCKYYLFHVVDEDGPTILGPPTNTDLNLVTMNFSTTSHKKESKPSVAQQPICNPDPVAKRENLEQYGNCFESVGCFQGEFHITVDAAVSPVERSLRHVPEALKEALRNELDSLVTQRILAKVTEPTDWVNSLVCVTKSNSALRLCLDPKDLNQVIKRPHYFTPTLEDILPKLSSARCFSILDTRSSYWNIKLDQESSLCPTFNSPF